MRTNRQRIVVSLGSEMVLQSSRLGVATTRLFGILEDLAVLLEERSEVVLVSAGSIEIGQALLRLHAPLSLAERQACAAIGHHRLLQIFGSLFAQFDRAVAPILVSTGDLGHRERSLNLTIAIEELTALGVVPLIEYNYAGSVEGALRDNRTTRLDRLAALIAAKIGADTLVLLTAGAPPNSVAERADTGAITTLNELRHFMLTLDTTADVTALLSVAALGGICGVRTVIGSGEVPFPVQHAIREGGLAVVSPFDRSSSTAQRPRRAPCAGILTVGPLACRGLIRQRTDLLPGSIRSISGRFTHGSIVEIRDERGNEVGRGLSGQSSDTLRVTSRVGAGETERYLRPGEHLEAIRADEMVIFDDAA